MKPVAEVLAGVVLGIAIGGLIIWGITELGDYIVEQTYESRSHSISNSCAPRWADGEPPALVSPAVAQVVWL